MNLLGQIYEKRREFIRQAGPAAPPPTRLFLNPTSYRELRMLPPGEPGSVADVFRRTSKVFNLRVFISYDPTLPYDAEHPPIIEVLP